MSVIPATLAPLFDIYAGIVGEANAKATSIKAAKSDKSEAVNALLDTSDNEDLVKAREQVAKIQAQIDLGNAKIAEIREAAKVVASGLLPGNDPNFDLEKETVAFREKRSEAHEMRKTLLMLMGKSEEALAKAFEEKGIVEVVSLGRNSISNGKGSTNIKRPRISAATVDGENIEKDGKVTFTILSGHLGVDGDTVRKAAFAAAGTEDLSTLADGTVVTFQVTKGDKVHTVTVTTKAPEAPAETPAETPAPDAPAAE